MKRYCMSFVVFFVVAMIVPLYCLAAGSSVTYSSRQNLMNGDVRIVTLAWVGDDANGTVPSTSTDSITLSGTNQTFTQWIQGYYLCDVEVNPGSTAPTALYDIAITNSGGASLTNGALNDLSATVTEIRRMAGYSGSADTWMGCHYVTGPLTITWSNTTVNSSTGTVTLYFSK